MLSSRVRASFYCLFQSATKSITRFCEILGIGLTYWSVGYVAFKPYSIAQKQTSNADRWTMYINIITSIMTRDGCFMRMDLQWDYLLQLTSWCPPKKTEKKKRKKEKKKKRKTSHLTPTEKFQASMTALVGWHLFQRVSNMRKRWSQSSIP